MLSEESYVAFRVAVAVSFLWIFHVAFRGIARVAFRMDNIGIIQCLGFVFILWLALHVSVDVTFKQENLIEGTCTTHSHIT